MDHNLSADFIKYIVESSLLHQKLLSGTPSTLSNSDIETLQTLQTESKVILSKISSPQFAFKKSNQEILDATTKEAMTIKDPRPVYDDDGGDDRCKDGKIESLPAEIYFKIFGYLLTSKRTGGANKELLHYNLVNRSWYQYWRNAHGTISYVSMLPESYETASLSTQYSTFLNLLGCKMLCGHTLAKLIDYKPKPVKHIKLQVEHSKTIEFFKQLVRVLDPENAESLSMYMGGCDSNNKTQVLLLDSILSRHVNIKHLKLECLRFGDLSSREETDYHTCEKIVEHFSKLHSLHLYGSPGSLLTYITKNTNFKKLKSLGVYGTADMTNSIKNISKTCTSLSSLHYKTQHQDPLPLLLKVSPYLKQFRVAFYHYSGVDGHQHISETLSIPLKSLKVLHVEIYKYEGLATLAITDQQNVPRPSTPSELLSSYLLHLDTILKTHGNQILSLLYHINPPMKSLKEQVDFEDIFKGFDNIENIEVKNRFSVVWIRGNPQSIGK